MARDLTWKLLLLRVESDQTFGVEPFALNVDLDAWSFLDDASGDACVDDAYEKLVDENLVIGMTPAVAAVVEPIIFPSILY